MRHKKRMSTFEIVPSTTNIQKEIYIWEARVSEKGKEVSELSIQIQDIKIALNVFLGEYNSRVGVLYVKLDKLKLKIKEYQLRIELAQGRKVTQEDLKIIEDEVDEIFSQERHKVDDLESETSESPEKYKKHLEEKEYPLDDEVRQECKTLYHRLARKFHPDIAQDEEQRKKFNKIMAAINEAYGNGDLGTLKKYMRQVEREEKITKEIPEEKLARLKEDYEIILGIITKLRAELEDLVASETYKLKKKVDQAKKEGRDLLQELANSINEEITENQCYLINELVVKYRKIIGGLTH